MKKSRSLPVTKIAVKTSLRTHGCGPRVRKEARTLGELVDRYLEDQEAFDPKRWNPLGSLLDAYRELGNPGEVLEHAAYSRDLVAGRHAGVPGARSDKRHGHQRRIRKEAMAKALKRFRAEADEINSSASFEELYNRIKGICDSTKGLGPVYAYDTALRIGAFLKKRPKDVYLHAGVLEGARILKRAGVLQWDGKQSRLPKKVFPLEIQRLAAHQIEDFLCGYRDGLAKMKF